MAMQQLSGIDASFLYMETPETPMHVAGLTLYEPPKDMKGTFHEHFKTFFAGRVHLIPIFRKKLAKSVFEIDHPGWVDAGDPDLDWHIQGVRLPRPGAFRQLEEMVGDLHSVRLDRTRPLWRFTVIEGLEDGRVALYSKVHHAAIDGGAGMVITKALYDVTPTPREVAPPEAVLPSRKPTTPERAVMGLHDMAASLMRQQMKMIEAGPKIAGQIADLLAPAIKGGLTAPQILAPKTPFNVTIGKERSYAARSVPLAGAKAIAKATGTKLNDVVMAVCAGALRSYLDAKQRLPDGALVAFVPISLRESGNTDLNNQVFGMNCPLATNYGDPLKRLTRINRDSRSSKSLASGAKPLAPTDYTVLGAPMLLPGLMQLMGATRLADVAPQVVNCVISNNAGPPIPLYCAGAKVTALYPVSIPVHGVGLNFTVQSYLDALDFGVTADRASVPDVDRVGDLLVEAFEELGAAVLAKMETVVAAAGGEAGEVKAEPAPPPKPAAAPAGDETSKPTAKPAAKTPAKPAAKSPAKTAAAKAAASKTAASKTAPKKRAAAKPAAKSKTRTGGTAPAKTATKATAAPRATTKAAKAPAARTATTSTATSTAKAPAKSAAKSGTPKPRARRKPAAKSDDA